MIKPTNIEYAGYAAATTGGIAFMVKLETTKERFPNIEEGMVFLSIIAPVEGDRELNYTIVSRLISNGEITHWGEDEELTEEEHLIIQQWCKENEIVKKANFIETVYKKHLDRFFALGEEMRAIFKEISPESDGIEQIYERKTRLDELREEFDQENANIEKLKNMKVDGDTVWE